MNVLVTGGCGMIGVHIAKYYKKQGHDVYVLDNLERSELLGHKISKERKHYNRNVLYHMGVTIFQNDVSKQATWRGLNKSIPKGMDRIFHMAAQCGVPTSIADPRRDFEVNAIGTFNMLEYAREHGSRVVYASTNKVYPLHDNWMFNPNADKWEWTDASTQLNGFKIKAMDNAGSRTPYGASKFTGDILCQEYHHIYGVPVGIFRMSCIYGTNQFSFEEQGWATWFAIALLKDLPIKIYGDGCQVRDMLWVEDVVRAYNCFMDSPTVDHGVWNLGGGPPNSISLKECMTILEDITGRTFKISYHDWRTSDQRIYTSDILPLLREFDWKPLVNPEDGLSKVVKWAEPLVDIF